MTPEETDDKLPSEIVQERVREFLRFITFEIGDIADFFIRYISFDVNGHAHIVIDGKERRVVFIIDDTPEKPGGVTRIVTVTTPSAGKPDREILHVNNAVQYACAIMREYSS